MEIASRSSSVYSSRRGSRIDLKEALKELDLYYWKTHQDFLHEFNRRHAPGSSTPPAPAESSTERRGRSQRPLFKRTISLDKDSPNRQDAPQPGNIVSVSLAPRASTRSKSWGPPRRLVAKSQREPSPVPSFHGPSEYLHDADTRAKLRMYFSDPDKFDEALERGFPSVMATPEMKESPVIPSPPKPSTRGRNLGLDVQRFMRSEVISWLDSSEGQRSPQDGPESESEREVENFARELAIQNAVPANSDEHYDREFDISDYENAIDDSQDDRGTRTPSPFSPITPPADEIIPLPLVLNQSRAPPGLAAAVPASYSSVKVRRSVSTQQKPSQASQGPKSKSEMDLRASLNDMIRTAPPLPTRPAPVPIRHVVPPAPQVSPVSPVSPISHRSHNSKGSMSSMEIPSSISSRRSSNHEYSYRPKLSPSKSLHRRASSHQESGTLNRTTNTPARSTFKASHHHKSSSTGTKQQKSQQNLRASMTKQLPPLPSDLPPPWSPSRYNYDSPSAYVAPRSPPATPNEIPRQMTLRMTLTRPELRATDEEIYGRGRSNTEPPVQLYHPKPIKTLDKKSEAKLQYRRSEAKLLERMSEDKALEKNAEVHKQEKKPEVPLSPQSPKQDKPSKLRKAKTDAMVIEHTTHDRLQLAQLGIDTEPHGVSNHRSQTLPLSPLGEYSQMEFGPAPSQGPLAQSAPPHQGEFRVAYAQGNSVNYGEGNAKENRRSLWKKMSFVGLKKGNGPAVVLP